MVGALCAGLLGRKIGVTGAHMITCTAMGLTSILSYVAFYEVGLCSSPVSIQLGTWIDSESLFVNWGFLFDSLTVSMLLAVVTVSALVHIFSVSYMSEDPHNQRFFSYLSMFTFFMLVLVAGDNYLIMFLGWEGIGISSYLLINFWYTRIQANKSAIKALTVNRVGDTFLSVGFFAMLWTFGNVDYATVFSLAPYTNTYALTVIGLLFLLAGMGKSAQLGLHTWLPDAMEGWNTYTLLFLIITCIYIPIYSTTAIPTEISTRSLPIFTTLHSLWYVWHPELGKFIKIVPQTIGSMFGPIALAHWIMDDGYFDSYGRVNTIILCTECYTKSECLILIKVLGSIGIIATLKRRNPVKDTYRLRISSTSIAIVRELVTPHMHTTIM